MSRALGSSNIEKVLAENRTRNLRGERRALWPLRHRSPFELTKESMTVLCKKYKWKTSQKTNLFNLGARLRNKIKGGVSIGKNCISHFHSWFAKLRKHWNNVVAFAFVLYFQTFYFYFVFKFTIYSLQLNMSIDSIFLQNTVNIPLLLESSRLTFAANVKPLTTFLILQLL